MAAENESLSLVEWSWMGMVLNRLVLRTMRWLIFIFHKFRKYIMFGQYNIFCLANHNHHDWVPASRN